MKKILIAGAGGQGIVSLGKIIAYSVMSEGLNVSCIPSYGPEMRGGIANCSVVYDRCEIKSPVFDSANILIAMNKPSVDKYQSRVADEGYIIIDSGIDCDKSQQGKANVIKLPLNDTAQAAGDAKSLNMVVLGVLSKVFKDFSVNDVISSVKKVFAEKQKLIATAIKALNAGFALV